MKELYAQHLDGRDIPMNASINVVVTPSHRITNVNRFADQETKQVPKTRGDWILRRHFAFVPPEAFQDHHQLGPRELHAWGQHRVMTHGVSDFGCLRTHSEARFGDSWRPGRGIPLAWVPGHHQRHVLHQRVAGLPTMVEFDRRLGYQNNANFNSLCPLCGRAHEDEFHAWQCTRTIRDIVRLQDELVNWLEDHRYMGSTGDRHLEDEVFDPTCLVIWATATKTQGFLSDKMGTADRDSLGTQFLLKAVAASARLWQIRFKLRDKEIRRQHGMSMSDYVKSFRGRDRDEGAENEEDINDDPMEYDEEWVVQDEAPQLMEL